MKEGTKVTMLAIINKRSRRGANSDLAAFFEILRSGEIDIVEHYPNPDIPVRDIIENCQKDVDAIVIGGGDGTLHRAAESLVSCALPVGILPLGTANDLARTLGIPNDLEGAARVILGGKLESINVGIVNGKYFFNVANIGLGVEVARQLSGSIKKKLGVLSYAKSFFDVFRRQRAFRVTVDYGNNRRLKLKSIQVAVGNGKFYGGGIAISEDADIRENGLVLYSLGPKNFWEAVILGPLFKLGKIQGVAGITLLHSDKFRVETAHPMSVSADGEIVSKTPVSFRFLPNAIKVYVPET